MFCYFFGAGGCFLLSLQGTPWWYLINLLLHNISLGHGFLNLFIIHSLQQENTKVDATPLNTDWRRQRGSLDFTFSINCVLESMRKSLKTECRLLSVALVSRIKLSRCFSISCVLDSIFWEKSWRNKKSWVVGETKKKKRSLSYQYSGLSGSV